MVDKNKSFVDKCIKDDKGNVVIGQKPNLPIITWIICIIIQQLLNGDLYKFVDYIGFGAIFTWAWLEIFQGVNYFRRTFGIIVMFLTLYSRVY